MEEPKPAEVAAEVVTVSDAVVEAAAAEKPKRKRTPRKPKEEVVTAKPKRERKPKEEHDVTQEGRYLVVRGSLVKVGKMTPTQRAKHGIKSIDGRLGGACVEPVTFTFKSPKAAEDFFDGCFNCDDDYEGFIEGTSKVRWYSDMFKSF